MKKAIIIAVVIVLVAVVAIGVLFLLKGNATTPTTTQTNTGGGLGAAQQTSTETNPSSAPTIALGDASIASSDITPGAPADTPQGPTIQFQAASGTITLDNFYTGAQGYWAPDDALLIRSTATYATWYYRDSSAFEIDIPVGGTLTDEGNAAAQLSAILGIDQKQLCSLSVSAVFAFDQGNDSEVYPLSSCATSTL